MVGCLEPRPVTGSRPSTLFKVWALTRLSASLLFLKLPGWLFCRRLSYERPGRYCRENHERGCIPTIFGGNSVVEALTGPREKAPTLIMRRKQTPIKKNSLVGLVGLSRDEVQLQFFVAGVEDPRASVVQLHHEPSIFAVVDAFRSGLWPSSSLSTPSTPAKP